MSAVDKFDTLLTDAAGYQSRNQNYYAGPPLQECKHILKRQQTQIPYQIRRKFYQAYSEHKLWKYKIKSAFKYYKMSLKYCKNNGKSNEKKIIRNRFFSQLSKCYYRHGKYDQVMLMNQKRMIILFDDWVVAFETSLIYKNIDQMMHYLKIIQKTISNKDQEQMYLQCILKYEIECARKFHKPTQLHHYYELLRTKWWKENAKPTMAIRNPYYYLFYCYLSLLLGQSGIHIDEIHIRNFILVDLHTTVQIANILTKVEGFQTCRIYSTIYSNRPKYVINLFYFGMFCLKFDHFIFAKKLFQKARHTSYKLISEKSNKMIDEINIQLKQKKCDNIYCSKNSKKLKVCSSCGNAYYCDRDCQSIAWEMHHKVCDNKWDECYEQYRNAKWHSNVFPLVLYVIEP